MYSPNFVIEHPQVFLLFSGPTVNALARVSIGFQYGDAYCVGIDEWPKWAKQAFRKHSSSNQAFVP